MNNVSQIVQTVRQAPWRQQRQWVGLFLLGLVLVSMVAGIYLNITVRATLAGREIQMLRISIANEQRKNADYETQLANLTSSASVQQRAEGMGFKLASPDEITYVFVPGYVPQGAIDMSVGDAKQLPAPILRPEYSESLFDWFTRQLTASVPIRSQP